MAVIYSESFESDGNGTRYTTSVPEFSDGGTDYFLRTDGSTISSDVRATGVNGFFYFGAQDIDGEVASSQQTLTISGIDITNFESIAIGLDLAEDDAGDGTEDWDADDFFAVEYAIDGGAFQSLLAVEAAEPGGDQFNNAPQLDTDFDGVGDGTEIMEFFRFFSTAIAETGATLDIRLTFDLSQGGEDIAVDNIVVRGDFVLPDFTLELLHIADQEATANAIADAPNLSAVMNALDAQDLGNDGIADNTLRLSSGDAFIPGVFFDASEAVYGSGGIADILIQNELGLEAIALGNHEFDFGTDTLAGLIDGSAPGVDQNGSDFTGAAFPYLSTNLDVSTDANLAPLETAGGQAPQSNVVSSSVVVDVNGEDIGVVGATTPILASISSPGSVGISPTWASGSPTSAELDALAAEIQTEVDALLAANSGMNKVILLAHMQDIAIEQALATRLTDVDIIVAGGSNTRLFDDNDRPRDGDSDQGEYPQFITDGAGGTTALVNTDGSYKYVGRLVIEFDSAGNLLANSYDEDVSGAYATDDQGVADLGATGLVDPEIQAIADAIETQIIATEGNVFGVSDVFLNGNRSGTFAPDDPDGVRTQETNLGNLTADANLAEAQSLAGSQVKISLKNGGGIRANIGEVVVPAGGTEAVRTPNGELLDGNGNVIKPEGGISQTDIQSALAFNNGLVVLTLTYTEVVALLENAVSFLPSVDGAFPQVSGVRFSFDETDPQNARLEDVVLVDEATGELLDRLMINGEVQSPTTTVDLVTLDFLVAPRFNSAGEYVGGGNDYPFPNLNEDPNAVLDLDGNGIAEVGDPAVIARVNARYLEDVDTQTGGAIFADDGTEQDALAEYLNDTHNPDNGGTAFDQEDVGPEGDIRIVNQQLNTSGTIFEGLVLNGTEAGETIDGFVGGQTILGAGGDDTINGSFGSDDLFGEGGADVLIGGFGFDDLFGGDANDVLQGDNGSDVLDGGLGVDVMYGGKGDDIFVVDRAADQVFEDQFGGNDTIVSTIRVDLDVYGGTVENAELQGTLNRGLFGTGGENTLTGNSGSNVLSGFASDDVLNGEGGDDLLFGGNGNDSLDGGTGADTMTGGAGADSFIFDEATSALDVIQDFTAGTDTLVLDSNIFSAIGASLDAGELVIAASAQDADDVLIYNGDTLLYDSDGNGANAAVQVVQLVGTPAISVSDFLIV